MVQKWSHSATCDVHHARGAVKQMFDVFNHSHQVSVEFVVICAQVGCEAHLCLIYERERERMKKINFLFTKSKHNNFFLPLCERIASMNDSIFWMNSFLQYGNKNLCKIQVSNLSGWEILNFNPTKMKLNQIIHFVTDWLAKVSFESLASHMITDSAHF